jgi:hypothetical protein
MTKRILLATLFLGFALTPAFSQPVLGGGKKGADPFGAALMKLFGDQTNFTAKTETQASEPTSGKPITIPGKMRFLEGNSRMEMDLAEAKGMPMTEQLKTFGMTEMILIARPDKKAAYIVYPGLKSYAEMKLQPAGGTNNVAEPKMKTTELGKEDVDGHPCVKNKVVFSGGGADKDQEFTVWNATDLKKFPLRLETKDDEGQSLSMNFKEVKFDKPEASLFDPPKEFTRYDSLEAMVMQAMMKMMEKMGANPDPSIK